MKFAGFSPRCRVVCIFLVLLSAGSFAVAQNGWVDAAVGFSIGGQPFDSGNATKQTVLLGFAGHVEMLTAGVGGNTAAGFGALADDQINGGQNSAFGNFALGLNTNGGLNTAAGSYAMYSNTTGTGNTATGSFALRDNTTGTYNTAAGYAALYSNTTASQNTAVGYQSLFSSTIGHHNTGIGANTLLSNRNGAWDTANGSGALQANTSGVGNSATGASALISNTTGGGNTADGEAALSSNTTGTYNTAVGYAAGPDYKSTNLSYATAIGAGAIVSQSNALVLGGTGTSAVNVGIGTATPSNVFTVAQGSGVAVSDGWTTYSSRRWKTNIHTLDDALGKVEKLRGVSYDQKGSGKHELGVIAEEVGAVVPEVVTWDKNGKDAQSVDYTRLTALLIEATKEQQLLIKTQQIRLKMQQTQITQLASQVRSMQAALRASAETSLATQRATLKSLVSRNVFPAHD
jgi:trimeric autotransporter adhesin